MLVFTQSVFTLLMSDNGALYFHWQAVALTFISATALLSEMNVSGSKDFI